MAAVNSKKTKSMECSYLKDHQLAFYYSVLAEHFEGIIKKNTKTEMWRRFSKSEANETPQTESRTEDE